MIDNVDVCEFRAPGQSTQDHHDVLESRTLDHRLGAESAKSYDWLDDDNVALSLVHFLD